MFSKRSAWDLQANPLSQALAARHQAGLQVLDLTLANPTQAGLRYPPQLQAILSQADASVYAPEPLGLFSARQAVAGYYTERGQRVSAEELLLTCSTSEAYALLFKLLADPGDQVLVPQPSYPLFEFLAGLEGVETRPYPLRYQNGWGIDLDLLAAALIPRTRAIVLVHPNNPTGSLVSAGERALLEELALERNLALIADEVFGDYLWDREPQVPSFAGPGPDLCPERALQGAGPAPAQAGLDDSTGRRGRRGPRPPRNHRRYLPLGGHPGAAGPAPIARIAPPHPGTDPAAGGSEPPLAAAAPGAVLKGAPAARRGRLVRGAKNK